MFRTPVVSCLADASRDAPNGGKLAVGPPARGGGWRTRLLVWLALALFLPARAVVLWTDTDTTLAHENGPGADILGGAVKRDDSANDTLYFKFHVDPLSDKDTEEYFAHSQTDTFYPKVEIFFRVAATEKHCHVPLLLAPFGYSTYRGS